MLKRLLNLPWWLKIALLAVVAAVAWGLLRGGAGSNVSATFTVRRGPLEINVLEGGSAEALESQDFKCEVRGYQGVKILKIVEEGYQVTEDDVRTNKILVELDSSELKKLLIQHEIQLGSTIASVTEARQAYDIQLNQNNSDIKAAEQKARFARMDYEKFMGSKAAKEIIAEYGPIDDAAPKQETQPASNNSTATSQIPSASEASLQPPKPPAIDFTRYANMDLLDDGEAKQKLRKFED